ncbi:MAG: hypothetical protein ACHREM_25395 [Polyangiales bacterium]
MKLTIVDVRNATHFARQRKDRLTQMALELLDDPRRSERLAARQCVVCFYGRDATIVGHGFTTWTCRGCDTSDRHANTGVPKLCDACSDKCGLCTQCCADLDLRDRKKVARGRPTKRHRP